MGIVIPHQGIEVKKVKIHHKVKEFYRKNLIRSLYIAGIIGLIGANIFSLLKYYTLADELTSLGDTQSDGGVTYILNPETDEIAVISAGDSQENGTELEDSIIDDNLYVASVQKFEVTFQPNNGAEPTMQQVDSGSTATEPDPAPNRGGGYIFSGWYLTGAESAFDFSTPITGDVTLYAKYRCEAGYIMSGDMCVELVTVSFDTRGGTPNKNDIEIKTGMKLQEIIRKYSYTENLSLDGTQNSNYGNNWGNSNIRGTDRETESTDAHVITIPGAKELTVTITYGGENVSDYTCVWTGSHAGYTATKDSCSSSIFDRLRGGNHTDPSNTKQYTFSGNEATFSFRSDSSDFGDGYGYYAVVEGWVCMLGENPTREFSEFSGWYVEGTDELFDCDEKNITQDITLYAKRNCVGDYHEEGNACVSNTTTTGCIQSGGPDNSSYIPEDFQITWNTGTNQWSTADVCSWTCNPTYHTGEDNNSCVSNTTMTGCIQGEKPDHSNYILGNVPITWNTGTNQWNVADNCAWDCNDGYHKEGNACISNTTTTGCIQSGGPDHSNYILGNVPITRNTGTNQWNVADNCAWDCNDGYHKEGNSCVSNSGTAQCNTGSTPVNATALITGVEITWTGTGWTEPGVCAWSCNTNYHKEGNECKANATSVGGGSYSGGGSRKSKQSTKVEDSKDEIEKEIENNSDDKEEHGSADEENHGLAYEEMLSTNHKNLLISSQGLSDYSKEFADAYIFAYKNGITTKNSIKDAKMYGELTRIQMAKMLSYYAINVLGDTPDITINIKFNDVSNKLNSEYNYAVTLASQLGIMGINMKSNNFRPNDKVTRAELVTALSRMIYKTEDGIGKIKYYEPHMAKLYNEGIITNTNPKLTEKRGYVMLMLMRSVK